MTINFVGLFNQPGYVGEISDETHIARELEKLGHTVNRIPRDAWREFIIEGRNWDKYKEVPADLRADINIVAKWHHFYDGQFITELRALSNAPVFYWIWDFMFDSGFPEWHIQMAQAADLLLSGEAGIFYHYKALGIKPYYFQMDVCDGDIPIFGNLEKVYDVIFTGSCIDQGNRKEYLQAINKEIPITIFSWNPEEWLKLGFKECYPAVYGEEYNKVIAQSKIVLGFSVEPNCWGYWSNRVGKVLRAGGTLLYEYAPGMETLPFATFSSPEEAIVEIKYLLEFPIPPVADTDKWTSAYKVRELVRLMERYLKGDPDKWNQLPSIT